MQQTEKYESFKALHHGDAPFVIPNPWDAGTARILTSMGFKALATTSAGYAFAAGKRDSEGALTRDEILANARAIVAASDLPVSADLEDGFGAAPEACATSVVKAVECGLVGGSIEDTTGDKDHPIHAFDLAVERVAAAVEAARGQPFLLTARADGHSYGQSDLGETIRRLQAFSMAGVDVLYAPDLPDIDAIRTVCAEVDKPVNVVMGLSGPQYSVEQLGEAGVQRISVGGSFARAALGAMIRAAHEVMGQGTFQYARDAVPDGDVRQMMSGGNAEPRE
ncbi:MAG: isocitrate lyase/phosphoenolpyruvate mutase family protein [Rhodobacteraceae bacterium]|nr:isocitrate lyase/phosphoenolpyruvate mutase family protein [Paracoccaceae bacterium]